ncbi:thermonuclease family protein [Xanthobacter pseudotagetidis]|uniref:thermonuclease family protein n=1 Tax=Xanthobacter pseudotagetidis TaxID=3119911 RepID=UPI003728B070
MRLRRLDVVFAVLLLAGLAVLAEWLLREDVSGAARAADGDTLVLNGEHVRLKGMDAPELAQTCTRDGRDWPCGREAKAALAAALKKGEVACTFSERDDYDRPLAHCAVAGADLGALLVRQGLAVAFGAYHAKEAEARAARRGMWAGTFQRPAAYRAGHRR